MREGTIPLDRESQSRFQRLHSVYTESHCSVSLTQSPKYPQPAPKRACMGRVWPSDTVNCQSSANAVTGVRQPGAVREGEPNRVPQARVGDLRDVKNLAI